MTHNDTRLSLKRRHVLRLGALAGAAGSIGVPFSATSAGEASFAEPMDYLSAAREAARWVRSAESREGGGVWLPEPDHPEKSMTVSLPNGFYSGSAGVILFFLELAAATGDPSYLEDAKRGGDYLVRSWLGDLASGPGTQGPQLSFYTGLAGTMFGLTELWKATQVPAYRDAALAAAAAIAGAARSAGGGVDWGGSCGMTGDSGIVLCLLHAAEAFGDKTHLGVAARAGDRIVERAEHDPRGGLRWQGMPPELLGEPAGTYWPNFQLGTSGVAFALARLYASTGQKRYLEAAKGGALHLQRIATIKGNAALIHYREPDATDLFYLGYCAGPAGTARLFYELYKTTKDPVYLEWTERLARGIMESGIPDRQTPGFWNVVCQCCGSAGVTDFFLGLWAATGKAEYRAFAKRVADQMLGRESDLDGKGYRWYQAYTRVKPAEVSAETGYMIGAAGIGAALLHLHLAEQGRYRVTEFPDNPFPTRYQA